MPELICPTCGQQVLAVNQLNDFVDGEHVPAGFAVVPCQHPVRQEEAVALAIGLMEVAASSHRLEIQLLVRTPVDPGEYADLARRWLTATTETLGGPAIATLAQAGPLPSKSLSRHQGGFGDPGSLWGQVIFNPADRRKQGSLYAWSQTAYERLLGRLDEYPLGARIEFSSLDGHGSPGAGEAFAFSAHRDYPGFEGLTRLLASRVLKPNAPDRDALDAEWTAFAADFAKTCDVVDRDHA